jgi:hypothetical protein
MANNVYQFQRLKWGDPEKKLEMLSDAPERPWGWFKGICLVAIAAAIGFFGVYSLARQPLFAFAAVASDCNIKGNISINSGEHIYHVPGQHYYDETRISPRYGERWFCSEEEARQAGWHKATY